jgi:hypothetical protein
MKREELLTAYRQACDRVEAATAERDEVGKALAAICPVQPGMVGPAYRPNERMWVDAVQFTDARYGGSGWHLHGRKLTKSGQPHATAHAWGFIAFEGADA